MTDESGMDVQEVQQILSQILIKVNALNDMIGVVDAVVGGLTSVWAGDDLDAFVAGWNRQHKPQAAGALSAIEALVEKLPREILQQTDASGGVLGATAVGGGGGLFGSLWHDAERAAGDVEHAVSSGVSHAENYVSDHWQTIRKDIKYGAMAVGAIVAVAGLVAGAPEVGAALFVAGGFTAAGDLIDVIGDQMVSGNHGAMAKARRQASADLPGDVVAATLDVVAMFGGDAAERASKAVGGIAGDEIENGARAVLTGTTATAKVAQSAAVIADQAAGWAEGEVVPRVLQEATSRSFMTNVVDAPALSPLKISVPLPGLLV